METQAIRKAEAPPKIRSRFDAEIILGCILEKVSNNTGVNPNEIKSKSKKRKITLSRFTVMYLARKYTNITPAIISKWFSQDHSMVAYSVRTISNILCYDKSFKATIDNILKELMRDTVVFRKPNLVNNS